MTDSLALTVEDLDSLIAAVEQIAVTVRDAPKALAILDKLRGQRDALTPQPAA